MLQSRWMIKCSAIVTVGSIFLAIFFYFLTSIVGEVFAFISNVFIGVFSSALLVLTTSIIDFKKKKYDVCLKGIEMYGKTYYLLEKLRPVDENSLDRHINYYLEFANINMEDVELCIDELKYCINIKSEKDVTNKLEKIKYKPYILLMDYYTYLTYLFEQFSYISNLELTKDNKAYILKIVNSFEFKTLLFIEYKDSYSCCMIHIFKQLSTMLYSCIDKNIQFDYNKVDNIILKYKK